MNNRQEGPLSAFIESHKPTTLTVQIVNRTKPDAIKGMLEDTFDGLDIGLDEVDTSSEPNDMVVLLQDGDVIASSPLSSLEETLLFVNSDTYLTGARSLDEIDPPDVVHQLSDAVFTLRGYPKAHNEKLVLTVMSRYVERQAYDHGTGTLRTAFQRLSRINDEHGTNEVYEQLGNQSGLDVHVYGAPDWQPSAALDLTAHEVRSDDGQRYWFVCYRTETDDSLAVLAQETAPREWEGFWTFDADTVEAIDQCIAHQF